MEIVIRFNGTLNRDFTSGLIKFPFDGKMSRISNVYLHVLVAIAIPGYVPDGFLQEEESDRALPDEIHLRHMTVN
ncbi:hypothetical protein ALC60_05115 [Trachymyrmex zeteki]|uniref:Uncharacterized protein n=1 Tax=Mycetomoellerius zeteki TaxID=64791 RepID=A0A151X661_9HYME|nr:hypothetical protein ALC60_05115 [Trachymyrmex zeteki]